MRIISAGVYLIAGWLIGALLSPHVSLVMAQSDFGNIWFWAWLFLWPILVFVKFIVYAIPVLIFIFLMIWLVDRYKTNKRIRDLRYKYRR